MGGEERVCHQTFIMFDCFGKSSYGFDVLVSSIQITKQVLLNQPASKDRSLIDGSHRLRTGGRNGGSLFACNCCLNNSFSMLSCENIRGRGQINYSNQEMNNQLENSYLRAGIQVQLTNLADHSLTSFDVVMPYSRQTQDCCLSDIFHLVSLGEIMHDGAQVFYTDTVQRINVFLGIYPFGLEVKIKMEHALRNGIQLSYKPDSINLDDKGNFQSYITAPQVEDKLKKVKERRIVDAIQAVRLWRQLYEETNKKGKRIYTLQQAARRVGIAKKTLDDYYNHLKAASEFNFNLQRFKESKVGILRKFVRIAREKGPFALVQLMPECVLNNDTDQYWVDFSNM